MNPQDPYAWQRPEQPSQPTGQPSPGYGQVQTGLPQPQGTPNQPVTPGFAPGQQRSSGHNPYEFIVKANEAPKRGMFGGDPFIKKMIAIVAVVAVLVVIGGLVAQAFLPKESSKDAFIALAQQQEEIVRVAGKASVARSESVKGFAANTQLSVGSSQTSLLNYLASKNVKVDKKVLILKRNPATDQTLSAAQATNTFDSVFTQTLATELDAYRQKLRAVYATVTNEEAKDIIYKAGLGSDLLIKQSGVTPVAPASAPTSP